jgi:hypothetical protein
MVALLRHASVSTQRVAYLFCYYRLSGSLKFPFNPSMVDSPRSNLLAV